MDWYQDKQPSKEEAFKKLLGRIHPGAIVLLHSTSSTNAAILDELLTKWEEMGYRFGTLDELVRKGCCHTIISAGLKSPGLQRSPASYSENIFTLTFSHILKSTCCPSLIILEDTTGVFTIAYSLSALQRGILSPLIRLHDPVSDADLCKKICGSAGFFSIFLRIFAIFTRRIRLSFFMFGPQISLII